MYKVIVEYTNGNINVKKAEDYNTGMEIYRHTKELHKDTEVVIKFKKGDNTLWEKQCAPLGKKLIDIVEEQRQMLKEIEKLQKYHFDRVGILDKQISNIMHNLFENALLTDKEKIDAYDQLKELRMLRREHKQQRDGAFHMGRDLKETLDAINNCKWRLHKRDEVAKREFQNAKSNPDLQHKIHKFKFENQHQKDNLIQKLKQEYSNIRVIGETIYCYNNCNGGKQIA